ncbi:MAG: hypothetical protein R3E31_22670 [Chloroflexota bacterium]
MVNTVVADNDGRNGGISPFWRGSLTNVTVVNNHCSRDGCVGGVGAWTSDAQDMHIIVNSILYGNDGMICKAKKHTRM